MTMKKSLSKCFIAAPANLNINALLSLLADKGISAFDAYTLWNNDIPPSIEDQIKNSDFLFAILSTDVSNANLFYEIGIARGSNKPIFLISQDAKSIPIFLKNGLYVITSLDNLQLISFYIDQFLSEYKKIAKKKITSTKSPFSKLDISQFKKRLRNIRLHGTYMEFQYFVQDLFLSQKFVVDASHAMKDKGADISIWVNSLESSFGNPILVELKMGNLSESILNTAERQMQNYLTKTNTRSGLIIYLDRKGNRFNRSKLRLPLVIRLDVFDLIEKIEKLPLDSVLLHERNLIAHTG